MLLDLNKNLLINGDDSDGLKLLDGLASYDFVSISLPVRNRNENVCNDLISKFMWMASVKERLNQVRLLMKDDGAIGLYVSDDEYVSLRNVMDEIFGSENYINTFLIRKQKGSKKELYSNLYDFLLVYQKSSDFYYKNPYMKSQSTGSLPRIRRRAVESGCTSLPKCNTIRSLFPQMHNTVPRYLVAPANKILTDFNVANENVLFPGHHGSKKSTVKEIIRLFTDEKSRILVLSSNPDITACAVMDLNSDDGGCRTFTLITSRQNCREACYPRMKEESEHFHQDFSYLVIG